MNYQPGDSRIVTINGVRIKQVMQSDGSWWNIRILGR